MSEFSDLTALYQYLEAHAVDHIFGDDIAKLFDNVSKALAAEFSEDQVRRCDWETKIFRVHFQDGEPNHADFGQVFDAQAHRYLESRLGETQNPILKARYSHVLWSIPGRKHAKRARTAVDAYIELVKILDQKSVDDAEGVFGYHLLLAIGNAFSLAYQTKYRLDEIKSEIRRLVFDFDFANLVSYSLRRDLIGLMLDSRWKPKTADLGGVAEICWSLFQRVLASGREEVAIEALELGAKIDSRVGAKSHDWLSEKASCYEKLMMKYWNTPNKLLYCQHALTAYKEAKQWNKVRELEKKYSQVKSTMPVATFTAEIDMTEHLEAVKKLACELTQRDTQEIIMFLMWEQGLLPSHSGIQEAIESHGQETHLIDMIPQTLMDARGHIIQHFSEPEERVCLTLLQNYSVHLEVTRLPLLNEIFAGAIREEKLSGEIVLNFLADHTWLGRILESTRPGGRRIEYRWLDLLAPSVRACFRALDPEVDDTPQTDARVLGLDSLILKIEGLLRELCESYGIATFYCTDDPKGRKVFREKDLNSLLHEDALKSLIDPSDLLFLKFVLVEHAGSNLRNKIAHCLIVSPELYSVDHVVLIIIGLLRLAKHPLGDAQSSPVQ